MCFKKLIEPTGLAITFSVSLDNFIGLAMAVLKCRRSIGFEHANPYRHGLLRARFCGPSARQRARRAGRRHVATSPRATSQSTAFSDTDCEAILPVLVELQPAKCNGVTTSLGFENNNESLWL